MRNPECLEYGEWRAVHASDSLCERPSKEPVAVWVWRHGAVLMEGTLFERAERVPRADIVGGAPMAFRAQQIEEWKRTPNLAKPRHYVFSVPDSSLGTSNPFRDHWINSDDQSRVYKFTKGELLDHVLRVVEMRLRSVKPEHERLEALRTKIIDELLETA